MHALPLAWLTEYLTALGGSNSLVYGAGLIGVLEGLVIARVFRASVWRALLALIVANYVSMFAGVSLRVLVLPHFAFLTLDKALPSLAGLGAGFLLLAALVEWPFLFWPLREHRARAWQAFKGALLAQLVSCPVLLGIYWAGGDFSLLVRTRPAHDFTFIKANDATVYFVSATDGHLWRRKLDGSPAEKMQDLPRHPATAFLFAQPGADRKSASLWISETRESRTPQLVRADFAANASLYVRRRTASDADVVGGISPTEPARLRERRGVQEWVVSLDPTGRDGFRARNAVDETTLQLGMETPFFTWKPRRAVLLPDNQVLVEFGDQLLALDLATRTVAVLARGTGPVVVRDEPAP